MNFLLALSLLLAQQVTHRANPSFPGATAPAITSAGASNCPGTGCVCVDASGMNSGIITIAGTWTATLAFYGVNNLGATSPTLNALAFYPYTTSTAVLSSSVVSTSGNGTWLGSTGGFRSLCVYATAFTSNTSMTVNLDVDQGPSLTMGRDLATNSATAALGVVDATVQVAVAGMNSVSVHAAANTLAGTTFVPECSVDGGTTWLTNSGGGCSFVDINSGVYRKTWVPAGGVEEYLITLLGGSTHARVRVSVYGSGTANVTLRATAGLPFLTSAVNNSVYTQFLPVGGLGGNSLTPAPGVLPVEYTNLATDGRLVLIGGNLTGAAGQVGRILAVKSGSVLSAPTDTAAVVTVRDPAMVAGGAAAGTGAITNFTVKAASTSPATTDTAAVMTISPQGDPCVSSAAKSSAIINVSSATTTQLVALSGSTSIYVCGFVVTNTGVTTITTAKFQYGTGSSCATGTTDLTGTMGQSLLTSAIVVVMSGATQFTAPSGKALCLITAGTTPSVQGYVTYVQQ